MQERERVTGGHTRAPDRHRHTSVDGFSQRQQAFSDNDVDDVFGLTFRSRDAVGFFNGFWVTRCWALSKACTAVLALDLTAQHVHRVSDEGPVSMYRQCSRYRHSHGTKQVTDREGYLITSPMPHAVMIAEFLAIFC